MVAVGVRFRLLETADGASRFRTALSDSMAGLLRLTSSLGKPGNLKGNERGKISVFHLNQRKQPQQRAFHASLFLGFRHDGGQRQELVVVSAILRNQHGVFDTRQRTSPRLDTTPVKNHLVSTFTPFSKGTWARSLFFMAQAYTSKHRPKSSPPPWSAICVPTSPTPPLIKVVRAEWRLRGERDRSVGLYVNDSACVC